MSVATSFRPLFAVLGDQGPGLVDQRLAVDAFRLHLPDPAVDDGLLDFVFAPGLSRWQMLTLLPKTLNGSHIHHPMVTYVQSKSLSITSLPSTPIQADGEVIDRNALEINYTILPHRLRIIV